MQESLRPYIDKKVIVLKEEDSIETAAKAMFENSIGCVLVGDREGDVIGILTDRDLVCRALAEGWGPDTEIGDMMTADPVMVDQLSSILDVVETMKANAVRRVPIFETGFDSKDEVKCLGVVTLDDLICSNSIDAEDVRAVVKSQVKIRERGTPNRMRTLARVEQTYQEFMKRVSESTGLGERATKEFSLFVLGSLVKRLSIPGARRFLSPFPKLLRAELEIMMVGPDKSITSETLVKGVMGRFSRDREEAEDLIAQFWRDLGKIVGTPALENACERLPRDLSDLLRNHHFEMGNETLSSQSDVFGSSPERKSQGSEARITSTNVATEFPADARERFRPRV